MFLSKQEADVQVIIAGDKTQLQELIHPINDSLPIGYSLAKAEIAPGESSQLHKLDSSELYYILAGNGKAIIDKNEIYVEPGSMIFIPGGTEQFIVNTGTEVLSFLCIVEPYWQSTAENILTN